MRLPLTATALVVLFAAALPAAAAAQGREIRVVQANVGNSNVPGCQDQVFKLCLRPVEQRATDALRALRPDVVSFQEILPPDVCTPSPNPYNLCSAPLEPASQVTRLLGSAYAQQCDDRFGWDCLAVLTGGVALGPMATRAVLPECEDTGFTLNHGTLRVAGWPIAVTNAHPDSQDATCRRAQLRDLFERALPAAGPALVLGDFNLDPYREDDASVRYWKTRVPERFRYASTDAISFQLGRSQLDPTGQTLDEGGPFISQRTLDHVVVRGGLSGSCTAQRIDGGGGMDHLAQVCRIAVGAGATPRFALRRRGCSVGARFAPTPPHLRAVAFRVAGRRFVDRDSPYRVRVPHGRNERTVRAVPLLTTGTGPARSAAVPARCAGSARDPSFTG